MPRETKFDADTLRRLIAEGQTAQQIMDVFGVKKPILKNYVTKLMNLDETFYKVPGLDARQSSGTVTFTKLGLRLGPGLLAGYGFAVGDAFTVSSPGDGRIVLEKS